MNFRPVAEAVLQGEAVTLCTRLSGPEAGVCTVGCAPSDCPDCYEETLFPPACLVILGAGHVGAATAELAHRVGLSVTVLDPRQELLTEERFAPGIRRIAAEYEDAHRHLPDLPACYLIATSSHREDLLCARQIMEQPFAFAGMLGSRRKAAMVRNSLSEGGIAPEVIDRLVSPVGLDIGAETPEEIAVSILAQLISVLHRPGGSSPSEDVLRQLARPDFRGTLITVIRKQGSTPRGPGAKLLVRSDGACFGTVGGGIVEYEAIRLAASCPEFQLRTVSSGSGEVHKMSCGGSMTLMVQPVDNRK